MPLSQKQLTDICMLYGTSDKCRFLAQDDTDYSKHYCLKKTVKKSEIDVEAEDFIRECRRKSKDPYTESVPLGDNCDGYPIMKYTEQGYDKKKP